MPATTRSANKQMKLEDVGAGNTDAISTKRKAGGSKASSGPKRKAEEQPKDVKGKSTKKAKQSHDTGDAADGDNSESIVINRAPVLELWASCVAHFLHPNVSWETCLSAGGAVSTITAISKGRSIGTVDKPDAGAAEEKRQRRKEKAEKEGLDELEVMSFKLKLDKNGQAIVGDKPKKAGEEALRKKYGPEQYDKVKKVFQEALQSWKGKEEDLNERAFGMYEDFRPTIPPGQQGWGRKGQLRLDTVKSAVSAA